MKNWLIFIAILYCFCSCKKEKVETDSNALYRSAFHGTYKLVSSYSDKAIDVNLDGEASIDMLREIERLSESFVQIKVTTYINELTTGISFAQAWSEQYFVRDNKTTEDVSDYDPAVSVTYLLQPASGALTIDTFQRTLEVKSDVFSNTSRTLTLPFDASFQYENDKVKKLTLVTKKPLYTSNGIISVRITSIYQR
ncbi:hypothetical protein [Pedobacter sp. SYP-B3415]|uniref:hypothetical protein n=1 Tax=Pedobacter sp. SYP-B3415 TaxID=2496641 RepID=UPI00101D9150|nr:hypothetical protein [Pedobacter sp. SYP-B3415]